MYYVGKNVPIILNVLNSNEKQCRNNNECLLPVKVTQYILLGIGPIMLYRFIPFFISKYYQSNLPKEHQTTEAKLQLVPEWILAAESLTLIVEFDALYTVIANALNIFNGDLLHLCSSSAQVAGYWVLWASFVLMYMFILYYTIHIQYCGNYNVNCSCATSNFFAIILVGMFVMFFMSNEYNPLLFCYMKDTSRLLRNIMNVLVLIVVITVIVLLLVYRCLSKTRQEKLLPRALYQQISSEPNEHTNLLGATDSVRN